MYVYMFVFSFVVTHLESLYHPEFFLYINIYLIYAVFIRLVLHYVWQPFCCPFYSRFSCMSVGVSLRACKQRKKKKIQKCPNFSLYTKNKLFCVKIIVLFVFMISVPIITCLHLFTFSSDLPASLIERSLLPFCPSSFLLYHHTFLSLLSSFVISPLLKSQK